MGSLANIADIVIVGCGAAGLSCALSYATAAREAGRSGKIIILEVAPEQERGGATAWTTAGFRIDMDRRFDPLWVGRVEEVSGGLSDLDLARVVEREAIKTVEFIEAAGVEMISRKMPLQMWTSNGTTRPNGGGRAIIDALTDQLARFPDVEFRYETEALRLVTADDGRIAGIVVRGKDGLLTTLEASTVMLACGGFEGNPTMLTQYVGDNACDLRLIAPGVRFNKGAGIRMAIEVGADLAGQFDGIHAEMVDRRTDRADAVIYPHPYGIVVNGEGERFYDEGQGAFDDTFELIAYEVWKNQKQTAFFITDAVADDYPVIKAMCDTDVPPIEADSIEELAMKLGLDPEKLAGTVAEFNAACQPGPYDPSRYDGKATDGINPPKSNWANPIDRAPFLAYPLTTAITFTYGGVKTDAVSRVLGTNGYPIPGLYAAGEIVGLFYHQYPGATSVLRALTFGRIAGAHAAVNG